jgi:hypothetical protein
VWHYIKSAFFVRVEVPVLGPLPINALLATAFAILGFAQPAFWLLGIAVETVVIAGLAFDPRFQNYVQAQQVQIAKDDDETNRQQLIKILDRDAQDRRTLLSSKCERVVDVFRSQQAEEYIIDSNRDALNSLKWVYLKLLVARHHLLAPTAEDTEATLEQKIAAIDQELAAPDEPDSLRQSKAATRSILKKRLANIRRRAQTIEEIDSDLTRIEAQVDLILENATMQSKPQTISSDIELASDLLGAGVFGEDESAISALDRKYSTHKPPVRETSS